jgi:hypothetical protein
MTTIILEPTVTTPDTTAQDLRAACAELGRAVDRLPSTADLAALVAASREALADARTTARRTGVTR